MRARRVRGRSPAARCRDVLCPRTLPLPRPALTRGAQVQSLKNLGLNISRAEVGEGGSGRNRFYITDAKARAKAPVWPSAVAPA